MYPILLQLEGRLCLVVGGGPVGRRKAAGLREGGARVRLVCLEKRPPGEADAVDWLTEPYRSSHLEGVALVFAAASGEVNRQVRADAHERGLWVNEASAPGEGDFFVPATVRRGDFLLAVSTGGAGPVFAQMMRAELEARFDAAYGHLTGLLAELRPEALACLPDPARRRAVLAQLCKAEWLERLRREGPGPVREALRAELQKLAGP